MTEPHREEAQRRAVRHRFQQGAARWDAIYSEGGSWRARTWDRLTRQNVRWRFVRTFEEMPDLRGRSVLDMGCGSGRYLIEALDRGASRVVGVDLAPEMLAIARDLIAPHPEADRVELVCGNLLDLRVAERFDLVIANGLFDYVGQAEALLDRAFEWSRGVCVASFPDRRAPRALPRRLFWRRRDVRIHAFSRREIEQLAGASRFEHFALERRGPLYLLVARAG
jgi:SAM-dependent methyltransferase